MKYVLLLIINLFASTDLFATHVLGGHITYKALDDFTYTFTIITYTDARSAAADRPTIGLNFGDGEDENINRLSQIKINDFLYENKFVVQHTYKNTGRFLVHLYDNNRASNITNMEQSVMQRFYLEALLVIDEDICKNSLPQVTIPPIFSATFNSTIHQALNMYDENGDSVVYELITPMIDSFKNVVNYTFPPNLKLIDNQLHWQPQQKIARYAFAVRVNEYRQGKLIGYFVKEWVTDLYSMQKALMFKQLCGQADTVVCTFDGRNNNEVNFGIQLHGLHYDEATMEMFAPAAFFHGPQPQFTTIAGAAGDLTGKFSWKPDSQPQKEQAYNFVFRVTKKGAENIQNDELVRIILSGTEKDTCTKIKKVIPDPVKPPLPLYTVYPNPFSETTTIVIGEDSETTYCTLYDTQGKRVAQLQAYDGKITVERNQLRDGLYLFHIYTSQKMLATGKLVLQK